MKALWTIALLVVVACGSSDPPASRQAEEEVIEVNYAEIAMVNTAHSKVGAQNSYFNETISDAEGMTKVCGEFARPDNPGKIVKYSYSLAGARYYGPGDLAVWESACSNGWVPGEGRQ